MKSAYKIGNSSKVGMYIASQVSSEQEEIGAQQVHSKCIAFPYEFAIESSEIGAKLDPSSWDTWFITTFV